MVNSNDSNQGEERSLFPYAPSHILPAVFAAVVGVSLLLHAYQNLLVHYPLSKIYYTLLTILRI